MLVRKKDRYWRSACAKKRHTGEVFEEKKTHIGVVFEEKKGTYWCNV